MKLLIKTYKAPIIRDSNENPTFDDLVVLEEEDLVSSEEVEIDSMIALTLNAKIIATFNDTQLILSKDNDLGYALKKIIVENK